jgi:ferrochelatase
MEVIYDLDVEAKRLSETLGINLQRAETASAHPLFVQMIRELIVERMNSPGNDDQPGENCAIDCCCPT